MKWYWYVPAIAIAAVVLIALPRAQQEAVAQGSTGGQIYRSANITSTTATAVWSTSTEERFVVETLVLNPAAAMNVQLLDGATVVNTYYFAAGDFVTVPGLKLRSAAQGNDLSVKASTTDHLAVLVTGTSAWY